MELIALGTLPPGTFAINTYESTLARSWGRAIRETITQNYERLECRVDASSTAADEWRTTTGGGVITRGVGGAMTGRPARWMAIDDPNKIETIFSKDARDAPWEWWTGVGSNRLHPDAAVAVAQQRGHDDDFSGRLRSPNHDGDPEEWMCVRVPALAEEETQPDPLGREIGDPLYRPDVPIDDDAARVFIRAQMRTVGSLRAQGQYQQRPGKAGGTLFKKSRFRYYEVRGDVAGGRGVYVLPKDNEEKPRLVRQRSCVRFAIVDLAASLKQEADFWVMGLFDVTPYWDLLVLDILRDKLEGPDQISTLRAQWLKWRPTFIGIEKNGYQLTSVQHARRQGLPVREILAEGDKWQRALTPSTRLEDNAIYFPPVAAWLTKFEDELVDFPTGEHDDQVDVLSYAAIAVDELAAKSGWSKN
jgi:predicted phage terminase large subunit-like protein